MRGVVGVSCRPSDWSAVGRGVDPVPGDAVVVPDGAARYRRVADAISRCAANLRALEAGTSSQAESVKALMEQRDVIVDGVVKAENRYRVAADALETYARVLDRVQAGTVNALYAARNATADVEEARRAQAYYADLADDFRQAYEAGTDDGAYARYTRLSGSSAQDAADAQSRVDAQVRVVEQAVRDRDRAAQEAVDAIETATTADGLNDTWWDGWGAAALGWVATISEAVAVIAGILALLVCWIPVIGQAFAGLLFTISAIAGIVAAIANIVLAATGKQSWTYAIVSVLFAALGCVGLGGLKGMLGALKNARPSVLHGMLASTRDLERVATFSGFAVQYGRNAELGIGVFVKGIRGGLEHPVQALLDARAYLVDLTEQRVGRAMMTPRERLASRPTYVNPRHSEGITPAWDDIAGHGRDADSSWALLDEPGTHFGTHEDGSARSLVEWEDEYIVRNTDGKLFPDWPSNDGYVAATEQTFTSVEDFVAAGHELSIDRIGHPGGTYFAETSAGRPISFEARAMDPRTVVQPHYSYALAELPQGWSIKVGAIAPGLGLPGGGRQLQIIDDLGNYMKAGDLVEMGVLRSCSVLG